MKWDKELSADLDLVEQEIKKLILTEQKTLMNTALYVIESGGKRIRPAVSLLAYKIVGGRDTSKIIPLAAGYELVHSATLIHDDINDHSDMRRGKETVNRVFGSSNALIAGDFLFVKGFQAAGSCGTEVIRITANACSKLAEGEILQQKNLRNPKMTEELYINIVSDKTAMPIAAGGKVGALLGHATPKQMDALWNYGFNLGITFQIIDDILDIEGDPKETGKPIGHDLEQGQVTLPLIATLKKASKKEAAELTALIKKEKSNKRDLDRIIGYIKKLDGIAYARGVAEQYAQKAHDSIASFPESKYKRQMNKLVDDTLNRTS